VTDAAPTALIPYGWSTRGERLAEAFRGPGRSGGWHPFKRLLVEPFIVGEQVVVQYGEWRGQTADVVEKQPAEVYKVRLVGGPVLFFGRASLHAAPSARPIRIPEPVARVLPSRN